MRWEEKYRPRKFSEIVGQDHAVTQLANLILNGKIERHIALFGQVGSGKTSSIGIFAMALNCQRIESDGSPCGSCESCVNPSEYLHEYDTAGRSGSKEDILAFVMAISSRIGITPVQVCFFDEVHRMSHEAQDALLVFLQTERPGLIICVATTDIKGMRGAFVSRFLDIHIRPLEADAAYALVRKISDDENIKITTSALRLFVAAQPQQARDLVIALQSLSNLKQSIDENLIKDYFDLGRYDHLANYFKALATGDRAQQTRSLTAWVDSPTEKRSAIESFVAEVYFNDIVGEKLIIDPLIHHMVDVRQSFMLDLMKRYGLAGRSLVATFEGMMDYWSSRNSESDNSAYLAIALFSSIVDRPAEVAEISKNVSTAPNDPRRSGTLLTFDRATKDTKASSSLYLNESDAQLILNRLSFFVQHYGQILNATALIKLSAGNSDLETAGIRVVTAIFDAMRHRLSGGLLVYIGTIERHGPELHIRIVAHVEKDLLDEFELMFANGFPNTMSTSTTKIDREANMVFHLQAIRDLCSGCASGFSSAKDDLRSKIGVRKDTWRYPGPTDCQHLFFSELLTSCSIEAASFPHVDPLLPLEAGAFKWTLAGWELREYVDRQAERQARLDELSALRRLWEDDVAGLDRQIAERMEMWRSIKPEQRVRAWRGWW